MNNNTGNTIYLSLVRFWLVSILVILPFQIKIATYVAPWSSRLSTVINNLDELTVIALLLLAVGEIYKNRKSLNIFFFLLSPIILFGVLGLISAIINGNSLLVTFIGIFDYIKNFLVIFIYAAYFRDFNDFKKIFHILFIVALILVVIALLQFVWAMGSLYILGKDITDKSVYIFSSINPNDIGTLKNVFWRFGIFRTSSLTHHPYILGLFSLLIFAIYTHIKKRLKIRFFLPLIAGVITSVSRIAYGGLIFITFVHIVAKRRWIILICIIIGILALTYINTNKELSALALLNSYIPAQEENIDLNNIRGYTRYKSLEIWKDHPFLGVGPGMFGGIVSFRYYSHIYEEYNVLYQNYLNSVGGIEQFWFQIMAETGIVGALFFGSLLIILFVILNQLEKQAVSEEMKGLFLALKLFIGCIFIYSIGSGINIAPVLFTYCAFVGMGLGSFSSVINKQEK